MTLMVAWVVFPLVLSVLSLGCGLLVERVAGARLPGALVLPVGLAALIVIAHLATGTDATAELAVPLVVVAALAGLVLGFRWRRELFPPWRQLPVDPWAAGAAVGVLVVFAAPIVFSGHATIAGYLKLEDTATWLAITDHVMEHGRNLDSLAPSSYEAILSNFLPHGYPYGSFLPMGVGHGVLGADIAWLLQPHMAFLAAMLALSMYSLISPLVPSRGLRAGLVLVASQAALLFGYSLWGGVKEVAGAWLLALLAALAAVVLRERGGARTLVPVAVAGAATLATLSYGGAVWIGAVLAPVLVVLVRELGAGRALRLAGAFVAMLAVLSIPSLVTGVDFLDYSPGGFTTESELGALVKPLSAMQVFGVWPSGDFRLRPDNMGITRVLFVIVLLSGLGGLVWAFLQRAWGVLIYVGAAVFITILLAAQGAPWVDAKTFANTTPAFLLAGMLGAAALVPRGRRIEAGIVAIAIAFGVVWSNALAYRDVDLAPHAQLQELQDIGERIEGEGPTLMNEYMPLGVRHFLREADPEGSSLLRRRLVPVLNGRGLTEAEPYADIDRFRVQGVLDYRTLVLRRSAAASRPPSPYKLVWKRRYYEVWQRPAGPAPDSIVGRLPLGNRLQAAAKPRCRDVLRLASRAGAAATLAAAERGPTRVLALARTSYTPGWLADPGNPALIFPRGEGSLTGQVQVPTAGNYGVWLGGSFRGKLEVRVDGQLVKADRHQLNHPEQYVPMGSVALQPGVHTVQISYGGADLHPGSGGNAIVTAASPVEVPFPIGPLELGPPAADSRVVQVSARRARDLCGRSLDWVEALRPG